MFESLRSRWLTAFAFAVVVALTISIVVSHRNASRDESVSDVDAVAAWKTHTGIDLDALPKLHPAHEDSADARALDALLQPADLRLGGRTRAKHPEGEARSNEELDALRDALRAQILSESAEPVPLPPAAVKLLDRRAPMLDAVAGFVAAHHDVQWREDFRPRLQRSALYTDDHLIVHRLLIGRGILALERGDVATAQRMLRTSRELNRVLEQRHELFSQFIAAGVERLQLALLRRAGGALGDVPVAPMDGLRERFRDGMAAEAAIILTTVREGPFQNDRENQPPPFVRLLMASSHDAPALDAIARAATGVEEVVRAPDGCAALARPRPAGRGFFAGDFYTLDATEGWRRFVLLALDRAMTTALLSGRTSSPCASVTITVQDENGVRTVEAKGLPPAPENLIGVAKVMRRKV